MPHSCLQRTQNEISANYNEKLLVPMETRLIKQSATISLL